MNKSVTYDNLFAYLDEQLELHGCDNTLRFTSKFAKQHALFFGEPAQILEDFGGYCDCEVMLNVFASERIDPATIIGDENFTTPRRYAVEHGLYCNCRIDGQPVCWSEAVAAKEAGVSSVEFWVPCEQDARYAIPDRTRASVELDQNGGR